MFFQRVLKGIPEIDAKRVKQILYDTGIQSNWLRSQTISAGEIKAKLNVDNLLWHLSHYKDVMPGDSRPFNEITPFISTTAGTAIEDRDAQRLYVHDAFYEAAKFATREFKRHGWIFYAYVYTLGKPSIELQEFAEEVRDYHVYAKFLKYRPQGEITAKIEIPPVRLHRAEFYRGPQLAAQLTAATKPTPVRTIKNHDYRPPEEYDNILGEL